MVSMSNHAPLELQDQPKVTLTPLSHLPLVGVLRQAQDERGRKFLQRDEKERISINKSSSPGPAATQRAGGAC
ncbi:hypothetical protein FJ365_02365 [Candidatus Dependentiae bacterium]|nr:hypothetical protein [Candidatus Dependentiae bacterium]